MSRHGHVNNSALIDEDANRLIAMANTVTTSIIRHGALAAVPRVTITRAVPLFVPLLAT